MLSVIIINSDIFKRYSKYAYFFNWFEDHKDVSICVWNKNVSENADIDELAHSYLILSKMHLSGMHILLTSRLFPVSILKRILRI